MILVYAICDRPSKEIYVGLTNNLERRIREHRRGQSFYTRRFRDFVVLYQEEYPDYRSARKREKYLKSGIGKEFLRSLISRT
ncbi:MAG: GIY-YIG nuclease family protein [Candidatus Vogelbacteria bacterium]|nr:GIY-YIG nuclease family protein [Candidatus Vogelbacteria bacterium]